MTKFGGHWIAEDNSIMRYVSGDERMIIIYTRAYFKRLVEKICYRLRINRRRSNVHIYTVNDLAMLRNLYELQDNEDVEFFIMAVEKKYQHVFML